MSQLNPPLTKEDFTQTCWQGVVKSSESKDCYTYSQAFQTKERQAQELGNLREKHVFYILKFTTNCVIRGDLESTKIDERFNEIFTSLIDKYLDLDFLFQIIPEISDPELQARLADILWVGTSEYEMAYSAIFAYLKSAIILKSKNDLFFQRTKRAFYLARKIQYQIENIVVVAEFLDDHPGKLLEETWLKFLQDYKLQINYAERVEKAAKSLASRSQWELAKEYWKAKADWHCIEKDYTNQSIALRESYYAEIEEQIQKAKAFIRSENPQELISSCYEEAIEAFKQIKNEEISEAGSRYKEIKKRLEDLKYEILIPTAFHETGHAFIYEIFEVLYKDIEISFKGGGNLNSKYSPEITSPLINKLFYACICFAGVISENEYKGVNYTDKNLSELFKGGGECDLEMYKEMGFPKNYEIPLRDITKRIITENWELVSKIANKLVEKKKMCSEDVKQLLGDWGLKEKQHRYILELERIPQEAINKE